MKKIIRDLESCETRKIFRDLESNHSKLWMKGLMTPMPSGYSQSVSASKASNEQTWRIYIYRLCVLRNSVT